MKTTLKLTTILATILIAGSAYAGSNNTIEFDLQGDNLSPNVSQDGNRNKAKVKLVTKFKSTEQHPGGMIAGKNQVDIKQQGDDNTADVSQTMNEPMPNYIAGNTTKLDQIGNGNKAKITVLGDVGPLDTRNNPTTHLQSGNGNSMDVSYANVAPGGKLVQQGNNNTLRASGIQFGYKVDPLKVTQTGDGNTAETVQGYNLTIDQVGMTNTAKVYSTEVAYPLSVKQVGNLNKADVWATGAGYFGAGAGVTQQGNSNYVSLNSKSSKNGVSQKGDGNTVIAGLYSGLGSSQVTQEGNKNTVSTSYSGVAASITQKGNNNRATSNGTYAALQGSDQHIITQEGNDNVASQDAVGNNNYMSITQKGSGNTAIEKAVGNSNRLTISQTGTGHTASLTATGNSNVYSIDQQGTGQTFNMNRVGNSMTMTIVQK